MNAVEIIDEIKHLPPVEQERVMRFVRTLEAGRAWTPAELSEAADKLAGESDPARAQTMKERIASGFYGSTNA